MMRAISQSQSTDSSYAFFIKPNFRFVNVTLIFCYPTAQTVTISARMIIYLLSKKMGNPDQDAILLPDGYVHP